MASPERGLDYDGVVVFKSLTYCINFGITLFFLAATKSEHGCLHSLLTFLRIVTRVTNCVCTVLICVIW